MADSLMGSFCHNVDIKGRMNFPTKLREVLGEKFIITKGLDNCLFVYSEEEWAALEKKIKALPLSRGRTLQRFFFSGAGEVEADKQGRIIIPQHLREYAEITKDVIIIGASNRAEIWDKLRWEKQNEEVTQEMLEEAMDELGF